jgi:hypothetical protein
MRKPLTITLEEDVLDALKKRSTKKHLPISRTAEEILRKALRL